MAKKKLTVYIDEGLIDALEAYSFWKRRKFSHVVEESLEEFFKKQNIPKELLKIRK